MAGATAGAASRLAPTATRLTWPESAATTGVQATCAASGTETASATQRGSHRISASRHTGARSRMPAVASTDSAKPAVTASRGHTSSSAEHGDAEAPGAARAPVAAHPDSATVPIAAARTTLGSARAISTKPTMPTRRQHVEPAPAHPEPPPQDEQEPDHQGQVGAAHREQVGQPGRAEVVGEVGVEPAVVAHHQRRHQLACVGVPAGDRRADRAAHGRRSVPPHVRLGDHPGLAGAGGPARPRRRPPAPAGPSSRPGAQGEPRPVRVGQQHHRRVERPRPAPPLDPWARGPHDLEVAEPPGDDAHVGRQLDRTVHDGALVGQPGQR